MKQARIGFFFGLLLATSSGCDNSALLRSVATGADSPDASASDASASDAATGLNEPIPEPPSNRLDITASVPVSPTSESASEDTDLSGRSVRYHPVEFTIAHNASPTLPKPRIMELWARYTSDMTYESAARGDAIIRAEKQLIVQQHPDRWLRILVYAMGNANTLDSGTIATLSFTTSNPSGAALEFDTTRQIFAPAEANRGLHVSTSMPALPPEATP